MRPSTVVDTCLAHENIELRLHETVTDLVKNDRAWSIVTNQTQHEAEVVVVATGALDEALNRQLGLPIRPVKGQVSHLPATAIQAPLHCTVTHRAIRSRAIWGRMHLMRG